MARKYNDLTKKEQMRVAYNFLQCEGYDDDGNEYDTPWEWYDGKRSRHSVSDSEREIIACEEGRITGALPADAF